MMIFIIAYAQWRWERGKGTLETLHRYKGTLSTYVPGKNLMPLMSHNVQHTSHNGTPYLLYWYVIEHWNLCN